MLYQGAMARKRKQTAPANARSGSEPTDESKLLTDLRGLIQRARSGVAQAVNSAQVLLYREIGRRLRNEILGQKRAEYGEQIVCDGVARFDRGVRDRVFPLECLAMVQLAELRRPKLSRRCRDS